MGVGEKAEVRGAERVGDRGLGSGVQSGRGRGLRSGVQNHKLLWHKPVSP